MLREAPRDGEAATGGPRSFEASRGTGEPLIGGAKGEAYYRHAVVLLSVAFLGVFGGFQAAQALQTSLNATLGDINLACVYGFLTLLCLAAPTLVTRLEACMGFKFMMLLCSLAYAAMVISNIVDEPDSPAAAWAVPILCNSLTGVAAGLLWVGQNSYVSRCATRAALEVAPTAGEVEQATSAMTTKFNSLFFGIYQCAGLCGNILASSILLLFSSSKAVKLILFCVLGCITILGALSFVLLPAIPDAGSRERAPSLLDTAHLAVTDPKTGLLIPLMVTNGMLLGFFFGDFQTDVTCPVAGAGFTGLVVASFYGANSLATLAWGRLLAQSCRVSRRFAYVLASGFMVTYLVIKLLWSPNASFERDTGGGTGWVRIGDTHAGAVLVVFCLAVLFACGDAFYECGPPMTLQTFYGGTDKVLPAMANYKLWQSLGFVAQFVLGVVLKHHPAARAFLLLGLTGVSLVFVLVLDRHVACLDGQSALPGRAREVCPSGNVGR